MAIKEVIGSFLTGWENPDAGGPEALQEAEQAANLSGEPQKATLPDGSIVEVRVDGWGRKTGPFKTKKHS